MWGLIHPDEKEDVGRKKKDGDRNGVKGEREVAPPRQLKAMRGTAVGSFLFGYVNPHAPHTHTHARTSLFNCSVKKAWVLLGGVMMEGNYGDTSLTPHSSPNNLDLPALFVCLYYYYHPALQHGYRRGAPQSNGFLTHLSGAKGGGTARGGWTGCVDSGGTGREGGFLASDPEALLLFFPLLPVVLWPTYR